MYKKIILICGMPRSGTSWLGQIFDSSPEVAFRMEPLFAYCFKNCINNNSSIDNIIKYFNNVYLTDDSFILQSENRATGSYPSFNKNEEHKILVVKTTRHHELLERYLLSIDNLEIISIIRHPCAVINSWINTDREFSSKECHVEKDWKNGGCRKTGVGEYWGFNDWVNVTKLHEDLHRKYKNFNIVKYSDLLADSYNVVGNLFELTGIAFSQQTKGFLTECNTKHNNDPYSVFKNKLVIDAWKKSLPEKISEEIYEISKICGLVEYTD
ncbi:MAG: hypothetical protein ACJA13_000881 [Paraglaciecola sp.]|jgi:hypothetical protein